MNVFVLCTGRCGSKTFVHACRHIDNFTVAHESAAYNNVEFWKTGVLAYPDAHIEVDNRLSWLMPLLAAQYGTDAYYVHLLREEDATAASLQKRRAVHSFLRLLAHKLSQRINLSTLDAGRIYYRVVNSNITAFLADKPHTVLNIESPHDAFDELWHAIGATGDAARAHADLNKRYRERRRR